MIYPRTALVVLILCLVVAVSVAQQKVKIAGVWQSLSQKMDGKEVLTSGKDVKSTSELNDAAAAHASPIAQAA